MLRMQKHPVELVLGDQHYGSTIQQVAIGAAQDALGRVLTGPASISVEAKFNGDFSAASSIDAYGNAVDVAVSKLVVSMCEAST